MEFWFEHSFKLILNCFYFVYIQLSLFTWALIIGFLLFFFMLLWFATNYLNNEIREIELCQARRCTRRSNNCKQGNLAESGNNKILLLGFGIVDPKTTHISTRQLMEEIHYAASKSTTAQWAERCIDLLQYYPKAVNHVMLPQKLTPFLRACSSGGTSLVKYMLHNWADVSLTTADGDTAMTLAVHSVSQSMHDSNLLELLVQFGCNVNTPKHNGWTPLHMAAKSGNVALIRWLINNGASPTVESDQGWTPTHIARMLGHDNAAKFLTAQFPESKFVQIENMLNALNTNHYKGAYTQCDGETHSTQENRDHNLSHDEIM